MGTYIPLNYNNINVATGSYFPNTIKSRNNKTFQYWERSLFQRACSVLTFSLPEEWEGSVRDFFYYCLFKYGYVAVFNSGEFGKAFQPCTLNGFNFYYQPSTAIINNPKMEKLKHEFEIGKECEIIKLTPDYMGIWDIIDYYAEKLSQLDNAINMSIINNKFAYILGARNKTSREALKKILDKINKGEPAVIYDMSLLNDPQDKDTPFQFLERTNIKNSYITTDQLNDFQTILNNFDAEIGIPTIPYQKKERLVTSEAESRTIDSTSRSLIWFDTLTSSIKKVNKLLDLNISVQLRYKDVNEEGAQNDGNSKNNANSVR